MKSTRHNAYSIFFHWAGALLLLAVVLSGELRHWIVDTGVAPMRTLMVIHIGTGMAGLSLVLPRLLARLFGYHPPPAGVNRLDQWLVKGLHCMLYALLIVEPLIGWVIVNAKDFAIPMPLLGFEFPRLVAANHDLVASMALLHAILSRVFYALITLHASAALWHHYVKKDDVLCRMTWLQSPPPDSLSLRPVSHYRQLIRRHKHLPNA